MRIVQGRDVMDGPVLNKSRDLSLDFLTGFSMVLVVFFHNLQLNPASVLDNIFVLLANTAVPVFFLVSGALFFHRPFTWKNHARHILQFYLAMIGWKGIYLAAYCSLGVPFPASKRDLLTYLFLFGEVGGIPSGHMWFIAAMLTVLLTAPVLRACMGQDKKLILYLMGIFFVFNQLLADVNLFNALLARMAGKGAWEVSAFGEVNPFSFRYSNYLLYYMLGAYLQEKKGRQPTPAWKSVVMVAVGLFGLMIVKYLQSGTFRWQGLHLSSGYYWTSTLLAASGIFLLAGKIPFGKSRLLRGFCQIVGASTLGIFYLHMPLIYVLAPALFVRFAPLNGWAVNLMESLLIVAVSCLIVWVGRKLPVIRRLFS